MSYSASVETPVSYAGASKTSASIAVTLPVDAMVFVNDRETTSIGSSRNYVSNGLEAGKTYAYKLRVEFEQDGEKIVEHKTLKLRAGDNLNVSFGSEDSSQLATEEPVDTELKVEVPADAQIFLSGVATKQQGTLRSFITKRLVSGQTWDGYTVRVELERDGQKLVQERTLTMVGGQTYELAFDFDAQDDIKIAQLIR
ncbi:MAG: TIGR03000 domain-containing protein [Planctomycetes bacterium]|nr:TIGR03000 domain-containing protein [Planctomycetota bacterium]